MPDKEDQKILKKLAKAQAKAVKKGTPLPGAAETAPASPPPVGPGGKSPSERSAEAAERQLQFHKWRLIFAAVSVVIALVSLIILLTRG